MRLLSSRQHISARASAHHVPLLAAARGQHDGGILALHVLAESLAARSAVPPRIRGRHQFAIDVTPQLRVRRSPSSDLRRDINPPYRPVLTPNLKGNLVTITTGLNSKTSRGGVVAKSLLIEILCAEVPPHVLIDHREGLGLRDVIGQKIAAQTSPR